MRRTALLVCGALAAVAIAAAYVVLGAPAPSELVSMLGGQPRIARGFIGMTNFGRWRLICVPGPPSFAALAAPAVSVQDGPAPADAQRGNACRINQEMRAPQPGAGPAQASTQVPEQVIVAVNFGLIGPKRTPAALLRLPPTARQGDDISLHLDGGTVIETIVRDCAATECLAAGTLTPSDWASLSTARALQVSFPAAGRQFVLLDLPVDGLSASIAALTRAEISTPN